MEAIEVFNRIESQVRSYCRTYPALFHKAKGSYLYDKNGREYLDFFCGAGALNYGHNNPDFIKVILDYISNDGIFHSLDFHTEAKLEFIREFDQTILKPNALDYKIQFTGPTGTNAVEAALKLARKVTGRFNVIAFTNAFHGMTLGALSATGNKNARNSSTTNHTGITRLPYDSYFGDSIDTVYMLEKLIDDPSSGVDLPAAIIVETIQAEGGVRVASTDWLKRLFVFAKERNILTIVDDIQVGCGRTGTFLSSDRIGIQPDMICLSKSISGIGSPMALLLIRKSIDIWEPGEHNGTFRGNNIAFIAATEALKYWRDDTLKESIIRKSKLISITLEQILEKFPDKGIEVRGYGMITGIALNNSFLANQIIEDSFSNGLVIESCGPHGEVIKLLPALTISEDLLRCGLNKLGQSFDKVLVG